MRLIARSVQIYRPNGYGRFVVLTINLKIKSRLVFNVDSTRP